MPYRLDLRTANTNALDRLIELGALDAEVTTDGGIAALMPDAVTPGQITFALGVEQIAVSPARGRDDDSVWVLRPAPIRIGCATLKLVDAAAFGTGLHPTTALCLEALQEMTQASLPDAALDVGTGSGVLALAALMLGVPRVVGLDIDAEALRVAAENARLNGLADRLDVVRGGPAAVAGTWPLVLANVLAAPLIEMAPALVRRIGHRGQLVLSGIAASIEREVDDTYRRLGMRHLRATARAGWVALLLQAPW